MEIWDKLGYNGGMKILDKKMNKEGLYKCENVYNDELVKGVVDVAREILAIDAEMHADLEQMLLRQGSRQDDLWGINLYPDGYDEEGMIEFDSMINVRPRQGNRARGVENSAVRQKIREVVAKWLS